MPQWLLVWRFITKLKKTLKVPYKMDFLLLPDRKKKRVHKSLFPLAMGKFVDKLKLRDSRATPSMHCFALSPRL